MRIRRWPSRASGGSCSPSEEAAPCLLGLTRRAKGARCVSVPFSRAQQENRRTASSERWLGRGRPRKLRRSGEKSERHCFDRSAHRAGPRLGSRLDYRRLATVAGRAYTHSATLSRTKEERMSINLVMPSLGESVIEGTITKWLVHEGDVVTREQPVVSVATDKADSDVPAPQGGRIVKILAPEGATVKVGEPLCEIETSGAS